ncbi:PDZ domain-containing protein, partial [bacterium]|nr:PDZ domain-containing protein [bacterium]
SAQESPNKDGLAVVEAIETTFRSAIERVRPSVVSVFLRSPQSSVPVVAFPDGRIVPNPMANSGLDVQPAAFGSGFVLRKEGLIATCYHVVRNAAKPGAQLDIAIQLHNGMVYPATIFAADPRSDLAVLKVVSQTPLELTPVKIADGSTLFPGQFVLALGNPFGVAAPDGSLSASWGIISNIRRRPAEPAYGESRQSIIYQGRTLVQTDARLNTGSSGSALINVRGELVGIGMALSAAVGFEAPGGFAQPTDSLTRRVLDTLAEGREVEYGFIGISFEPTVRMTADGQGRGRGVEVIKVQLASALQAGLVPGDVVVEVDGKPVGDLHDLILAVGSLPAGTKLRTKVLRGNAQKEIILPLGKYPLKEDPIVTNKRPDWNGIRVDYISTMIDAIGGRFALEENATPPYGVVVREVISQSVAAQKGIQPRQVILEINGQKIFDPDDFDRMLSSLEGPVRLKFEGGAEHVFERGPVKK